MTRPRDVAGRTGAEFVVGSERAASTMAHQISPRRTRGGTLLGTVLLLGCTHELTAPDCYNDGQGVVPRCQVTGADFDTDTPGPGPGDDATGGGVLQLDCSPPAGAAGALYDYTPSLRGAQGSLVWTATGVPEGLRHDPNTGALTGMPVAPGEASITVSVLDQAGNTATALCGFTVFPTLAIDLEPLYARAPACIGVGGSLTEFLVPGTGNATPVLCDTPSRLGDGKRPPGVTVDPVTCELSGQIDEPGIGTWVFIVRARQSGREVYAPYCVTDANADDDAYAISVEHSGLDADEIDPTLVPLLHRYEPGRSFYVGGNDDPLFRIVDSRACASGCAFRYQYGYTASLFDLTTLSFTPENLLRDPETDETIGFSHNLLVSGPGALGSDELRAYAERPWVFGVTVDYCMSSDPAHCSDAEGNFTNANGRLEFSILMAAEQGS